MAPRCCFVALLAIMSSMQVDAQVTPGAQATFKSGIDLVRFDIRVVDDAGRPITDLRREEIEIREGGSILPTVLFQRITEPAESFVDAAVRAVTAEVSSNEAFPRGHLYILLFDQQHITPGQEHRAKSAAEAFIRRRVRPSDRVALVAIPGPGPQLGFTSDKTRAIAALSTIRGSYQRVAPTAFGTLPLYDAHRIVQGDEKLIVDTLARLTTEGGADLLGISTAAGRGSGAADDMTVVRRLLLENARSVVNQSDAESRQFLQRLADVIAGFGDIEGRKSVVLFSEGFFQDNLSRELEAVAAAAARTYCVFYTFDLNARGASIGDAYASDTTLANEIQARIAPLGTLAVETDGMMVIDASARSAEALDRIADQSQDYYIVGFTPSDEARLKRGQYQRVSITVTRPGGRVSARTGYALGPEASPADRRRAINGVLGAPFVQQGLKIDYTTYVMKADAPGLHRVVLSLSADMPVRSKPNEQADVVFVARDVRDGRVVASGTDTMALPASATRGGVLGTGTWRVQFTVPAGAYLMRAVVREPGGLVGSADRRIDVRPLDGPDVTVSDLILGSAAGALPVRAQAYTDDGLSGVIEAYGRSAVGLEGVEIKLELRRPGAERDDGTVAVLGAEIGAAEALSAGTRRRASFLLPLQTVPPGDYVAHAIVRLRGEIIAERTRQVEVFEGRAPVPAAATIALVRPLEIVQGELGRTYVASLAARATGTVWAGAAERARLDEWERVEVALQGIDSRSGMVAHALRGLARFVREDYAGAATSLTQALADDPRNAVTSFLLGWAHERAGDARAALSAWRGAAHLDPSLVPAHLALAEGYLKLSQPALAVQALRAGLAALPSSPELLARLSQIERK